MDDIGSDHLPVFIVLDFEPSATGEQEQEPQDHADDLEAARKIARADREERSGR